jgi:diguanylate cyclase (GGDEF)-like protein
MTSPEGEDNESDLHLTWAQLGHLLDYVDATIIAVDADAVITFASPAVTSLTGYSVAGLVGRRVEDFLHPDDFATASELMDRWHGRLLPALVPPMRVRLASGEWASFYVDAVTGADVEPFGSVVVTLRRSDGDLDIERELRQRLISEGRLVRLASAFVTLPAEQIHESISAALEELGGMSGVDRVQIIQFDAVTDEMVNSHEWAAEGIPALLDSAVRLPQNDLALIRAMHRLEDVSIPSVDGLGPGWESERAWFRSRDVKSVLVVPLTDQGRVTGFIGFEAVERPWTFEAVHVVTLRSAAGILAQAFARHAAERQLAFQARHDPLTELPNRWAFLDVLSGALTRLQWVDDGDLGLAVLLLDLDRFKVVNDSLGHGQGDDLLVALARRLEAACPEGAMLARMGGDEFVLLLEGMVAPDQALAVAQELRRILRRPVQVQGQDVSLSASVGIAFTTDPDETADDLLRHADAAMYAAKELGRDRVEVFDESLRLKVRRRLQDEIELRQAVEQGELTVYYQPEIEVPSGRMIGAEALVRWRHPRRGLLSAAEFIDMAEETGLILDIGLWVLREACQQQADWQASFPQRPMLVRVNLSARQLSQYDLVSSVVAIMEDTGIQPAQLCLEITETTVMADADVSVEVLEKLRGLGVELAIDDFGTGYSSLSYLKRFPVDVVKIDRSFVDGLGVDPDDSAIVQAIMVLAGSLGMSVTAEGVETSVQLDELIRLGCSRVQGYLFAQPEPPDAFARRLAAPT